MGTSIIAIIAMSVGLGLSLVYIAWCAATDTREGPRQERKWG
jgi:hypothetical protein